MTEWNSFVKALSLYTGIRYSDEDLRMLGAVLGTVFFPASYSCVSVSYLSSPSPRLFSSPISHLLSFSDHAKTGFVSASRFTEFLKGFGPVKDSVANVHCILLSLSFSRVLSRHLSPPSRLFFACRLVGFPLSASILRSCLSPSLSSRFCRGFFFGYLTPLNRSDFHFSLSLPLYPAQ